MPLDRPSSAWDVAPTLLTLFGFPAAEEMPGRSVARVPPQPRIATYGDRATAAARTRLDQEYYDSLKSLGYIR
jgi:arylsulfatase A-like enzyme